jgi:putative transposase
MYVPGYTYHLVQRGNNRQACFFEDDNFRVYLALLGNLLPRYETALHAFCLMTNHVHLLLTPSHPEGISRMMQALGSTYALYINKKYERTGSLWEGRHKASVIDTETYLMRCYRYIEMNPVAAQIVSHPKEYPWSSAVDNAWQDNFALLTPHPSYQALGKNLEQRRLRYRVIQCENMKSADRKQIELALNHCMPLGGLDFITRFESQLGRKVGKYRPGRPSSAP